MSMQWASSRPKWWRVSVAEVASAGWRPVASPLMRRQAQSVGRRTSMGSIRGKGGVREGDTEWGTNRRCGKSIGGLGLRRSGRLRC